MKSQIFRGLSRNVFLLGWVSLMTDIGSQMVFPLIPLYLTTVLGAGALAVGIVEGAAETTASLLKVFSGYWSDKIQRRKPFVFMGYSLSAISKPLFALASGWGLVLFFRVIERIGKGLRAAPRDALVAESSNEISRGKAYGFQRAMDGVGSVVGALLGFLLLPIFGYRDVFLFAFIPSAIAVFFILFLKEKNARSLKEKRNLSLRHSFTDLPGKLKLFILVASIFSLGHFGYAFLLLKAQNIGLADDRAILLYVLFYVIYTVCSIPFGIWSDKVGRKRVLTIGYLLFSLISLSLVFISSLPGLVLVFIVYGIFYAMIDGAQRAFVADLAPQQLKATALGAFHTSIGLVALPGGIIGGALWDKLFPGATFLFGFSLAMVALIIFVFIKADVNNN